MKQLSRVLGFALVALLFSCGSEDSPSGKKMLSGISMTSDDASYNNNYSFTYDNKRRLTHMSRTGATDIEAEFHYGSGSKATSVTLAGAVAGELALTYDSENRLTGYQLTGNPAGTIVYSGNNFVISTITGSLDEKGSLKTFDSLSLSYDASKKGPMANVNGFDAILFALIESNMPYFYSRTACVALTNSDDANLSFTMANIYGSDGFPTLCQVTGEPYNATLVYSYSN